MGPLARLGPQGLGHSAWAQGGEEDGPPSSVCSGVPPGPPNPFPHMHPSRLELPGALVARTLWFPVQNLNLNQKPAPD